MAPFISWSTRTKANLAPEKTERLSVTSLKKLPEGCELAGAIMGCTHCYIYIRGEYVAEAERLQAAIDEAYAATLISRS